MDFLEFVPQGLQGLPDPRRGDLAGAQPDQRSQRQDVREPVGFRGWNQILLFPGAELPCGNAQQPANFFARINLLARGSRHGESVPSRRASARLVSFTIAGKRYDRIVCRGPGILPRRVTLS
jgi:hypothetical protein